MAAPRLTRHRFARASAVIAVSVPVIVAAVAAGVVLDRRAPKLMGSLYDPSLRALHRVLGAGSPPSPASNPGPTVAQMSVDQFEVRDPGGSAPGTVLLVLQGPPPNGHKYPPRIVEVDRAGRVAWEYRPPVVGRIGDVRKLANGDVLYEIHQLRPSLDPAGLEGLVIEVDRAGHEVRRTQALVDHHAELLPSGNLLVVSASTDSVSEVTPAGATVWSWKAADHVRPYNPDSFLGWDPAANLQDLFAGPLNPAPGVAHKDNEQGWLHTNSAQRLANGDTLISQRNADTVIEVDRAGDVVASYGALIFKHQHCAFVIPPGTPGAGHMLVTDNGNGRVIEMDMATQRITWKYDTGLLFPEEGCAYRLPDGDTLITDSSHRRVLEVNLAGMVTWELVVTTPNTAPLYRAWWSPAA